MTGWRIVGGAAEPVPLPFTVPGVSDDGKPVVLTDGPSDEHFESFTFPQIVGVATKLTPWATWYAAPKLSVDDCAAVTIKDAEIVLLKTYLVSSHAITSAYHEAWHLTEKLMRDDWLSELDARLATGPDWPGGYLPLKVERRARAFAAFGSMLHEGCRVAVSGLGVPREMEIFWCVFSGAFGKEIMALRAPPPPPPPPKSVLRRVLEWI